MHRPCGFNVDMNILYVDFQRSAKPKTHQCLVCFFLSVLSFFRFYLDAFLPLLDGFSLSFVAEFNIPLVWFLGVLLSAGWIQHTLPYAIWKPVSLCVCVLNVLWSNPVGRSQDCKTLKLVELFLNRPDRISHLLRFPARTMTWRYSESGSYEYSANGGWYFIKLLRPDNHMETNTLPLL